MIFDWFGVRTQPGGGCFVLCWVLEFAFLIFNIRIMLRLSWLWIKRGGCRISSAVGLARPIVWCVIYVAAMNLRRLRRDLRFPGCTIYFWMPSWCLRIERMKSPLTPTFSSSTTSIYLVFFCIASWPARSTESLIGSTAPRHRVDSLPWTVLLVHGGCGYSHVSRVNEPSLGGFVKSLYLNIIFKYWQ